MKPQSKAAQYPSAVSPITGRVVNMSASAFNTWSDCKRKWFYQYVARIETPKSPALTTGIAVHDILEKYLKTGEKPAPERFGSIATAGLHLLPEPGTVDVESWVKAPCGPLPFVGKVDWYTLAWGHSIGDHKTTSDFKWAQTPESLAHNPQMLAYAYCLWKDSPPESVSLTHVYYRTRGTPASLRVDAKAVPWSHVEAAWKGYEAAAVEMAEVIGTDPLQALANPSKCGKYGGCPFADRCADSPTNIATKTRRAMLARTPQKASPKMSKAKSADRAKRRAAILAASGAKEGGVNPPDAAPHETAPEHRGGLIEEAAATLTNVLGIMGGSLPVANAEAAIGRVGVPVEDLRMVLDAAGMHVDGDMVRAGPGDTVEETKKERKARKKREKAAKKAAKKATPLLDAMAEGEIPTIEVPLIPTASAADGDWTMGLSEDNIRATKALLAAFPAGTVATFAKIKKAIAAEKIWGRIHRSRVAGILEDGATAGLWEYDVDNLSLLRPSDAVDRTPPTVDRTPPTVDRTPRKGPTPANGARFVYLGCIPEGIETTPLWELIGDIENAAKDGHPSPYLRPYNDGAKAVASALASAFYRGECLDWTHLYIPRDYPSSMLLDLLRDLPDVLVIRGGI